MNHDILMHGDHTGHTH